MGICDLCSGAHDRDGASMQKYPAVDADTGKYHRRCMDVYRHHFCGNSCDNSLQSDFSDYPCDGRFQNTGLFSGDVGTVKYCTRSVLKMGVAGAALATVISQAISGICCLVYMIRKYEILRMQGTEGKADPELMLRLAGMGVPMGLQYSVTAIGSVILQSAVNTLGSTAVAAVTASGRISGFFVCPSDALGATMATWAGQNMGAKKPKRIREGLRMANIYGIVYALIAFGILAAAGKYMALLFVDGTDPELMNRIQQMLLINSGSYTFLILVNNVRFLIQGIGFSTLAIFSGVSEMIARGIAGFVLVPMFGFLGACVANPLAWLFADLFLIPAYLYVMRRVEDFFAGKREQL